MSQVTLVFAQGAAVAGVLQVTVGHRRDKFGSLGPGRQLRKCPLSSVNENIVAANKIKLA